MVDSSFQRVLPPEERFQFGIRSILACMLGCALAAAGARHFWTQDHLPIWLRLFLAGLVGGMIVYLTLRLPFLLRHLRGVSARQQALKAHKKDLAEWAEKRRDELRRRQLPSEPEHPPGPGA